MCGIVAAFITAFCCLVLFITAAGLSRFRCIAILRCRIMVKRISPGILVSGLVSISLATICFYNRQEVVFDC
jgi:hypothetical protein